MPSAATIRRHWVALQRRRYRRSWAAGGSEPLPVTFPTALLVTRVYIALGADLSASWLTWQWLDITDRVRHDLGITVTEGRGDERSLVTPSKCTLKLDNDDGHMTRRNPLSPYYGLLTPSTPIWIQVDPGSGFADQFHGYVTEWPPAWSDESAADSFVTIRCCGVMERLATDKVLRSPVYRSIYGLTPNALRPLMYHSLEDRSTQFASAIAGAAAVTPAGSVSFASDSDLAGSDALPTFSDGASATFPVPLYTNTGAWMVQLVVNVPSEPVADTVIARFETGNEGAIARYDLAVSPTQPGIGVYAYDPFGGFVAQCFVFFDGSSTANPLPADFYGLPWSVRFVEKSDGAGNVALFTFLSGQDGQYAQSPSSASSSPSTIRSVTLAAHAATSGLTFGHLAVHADAGLIPAGSVTTDVVASVGALGGWDGEQAHARVKRLCREEGVQVQALAAESARMGPQGSGSLLAELRACESADQGVLHEYQFGIGYVALSERYAQPVSLLLDFDSGHIAGVPQPADDNQRLINRFTASRPGGSSGTWEKRTGTLGTGPGGSGVRPGSTSVNVETDAQLVPYAGWRVRLGTVDEDRWPQLGMRFQRSPELIPQWLAAPFGARVNISHPPSQMNPDVIDGIIEGVAKRWDQFTWAVGLNISPASPYIVGTAGDSNVPGSWLQTGADTALSAELAEGATSAVVAVDGPLFSTDAADLAYSPLSLRLGGETVPVSAISGGSSPQTFTITRTLAKTHAVGTKVEVHRPAVAAY